jgi:hypothetical protein
MEEGSTLDGYKRGEYMKADDLPMSVSFASRNPLIGKPAEWY